MRLPIHTQACTRLRSSTSIISELFSHTFNAHGMQPWGDRQGSASDTDGVTGDGPERVRKTPLRLNFLQRPSTRPGDRLPGWWALRSKPKPSTPTPAYTLTPSQQSERERGGGERANVARQAASGCTHQTAEWVDTGTR